MKRAWMVGLVMAGLVTGGMVTSVFAQNASGYGCGYGGPPKSAEERAARQAACLGKNGGVCPNGGPRTECPQIGQGQGKQGKGYGLGQGWRRGARDGTGPRAAGGTCPRFNQAQPQK